MKGTGKAEALAGENEVTVLPDMDPTATTDMSPATSSGMKPTISSDVLPLTPPDAVSTTISNVHSNHALDGEREISLTRKESQKIILAEGKTLRLLALDLFGNREFWVYIYLENRDKIPDPNKVASGVELLLPEKSAYLIDAADAHSVAKARSLGDEILKNY